MQSEWDAWNEWTPNDQDEVGEESFRDTTNQSTIVVPSVEKPSVGSQGQPTLLGLTPVQRPRVLFQDARSEWTTSNQRGQLDGVC